MTMASQLLPLEERHVAGQAIETVNSWELHDFLEVRRNHATWIRDRIQQYGFIQDQDFVCSTNLGSKGRGGHNRVDYFLSLNMAKELAMVERTPKGREARQYFIECERRVRTKPTGLPTDIVAALNDPHVLRQMLLGKAERVIELEDAAAEQAPRLAAYDRLATAGGALSVTAAAKALQVRPGELFQWMYSNGWIYRPSPCAAWKAYQKRLDRGLLLHKITTLVRSDGTDRIAEQVLVTPAGLARLAELIEADGATALKDPAVPLPRRRATC